MKHGAQIGRVRCQALWPHAAALAGLAQPGAEQRRPFPDDLDPINRARRDAASNAPAKLPPTILVEVERVDGLIGRYGPISRLQAFIIATELTDMLIGRDARSSTRLWESMTRRDFNGRRGDYLAAVGAVDAALWDLRGKALGLPCHELLGGPTRDSVHCYASLLDFAVDEEALVSTASRFKAQGFPAQKWFLAGRPGDADAMAHNLAQASVLRRTLGDDYPLMLDAWTVWDLDFAIDSFRRLDRFGIRWIEEPLSADALDGYRRLHGVSGIGIAAGEHLLGTRELKPFLDAGVLDVVQFDLAWGGGLTEALRVCALARAHERSVIAHAGSLPAALSLAFALPAYSMPWLSYAPRLLARSHAVLQGVPQPHGGQFGAPVLPGLGIEIDRSRVASAQILDAPC